MRFGENYSVPINITISERVAMRCQAFSVCSPLVTQRLHVQVSKPSPNLACQVSFLEINQIFDVRRELKRPTIRNVVFEV